MKGAETKEAAAQAALLFLASKVDFAHFAQVGLLAAKGRCQHFPCLLQRA
jgi:hypothetical protein